MTSRTRPSAHAEDPIFTVAVHGSGDPEGLYYESNRICNGRTTTTAPSPPPGARPAPAEKSHLGKGGMSFTTEAQ
ncbi:hypothetical protein Taro_037345 [Colocasia esculenta]|uniref:Uncharacterized protein n=1 Tax=Colocasia esculenta TaxID=4460 RepID=A0A843WPF1_COLES|nr:hypothetical protein [Colocasia esculenta]